MSIYDFSIFSNTTAGLIATSLLRVVVQNGEIYVAASRRVFQWLGNQFQLLYTSPYANITDLAVDSNNQIWVSLEKRGIQNISQASRILLDGPLDNYIGEVYVDQNRRIWCSSGVLGEGFQKGIYVQTSQGWFNFYFYGGNNDRFRSLNSSNPISTPTSASAATSAKRSSSRLRLVPRERSSGSQGPKRNG